MLLHLQNFVSILKAIKRPIVITLMKLMLISFKRIIFKVIILIVKINFKKLVRPEKLSN